MRFISNMGIGLGIYTTNNTLYNSHGCPFLLAHGQGMAHAPGQRNMDPTGLASTAQQESHRPTGACNTGLHHPTQPVMGWAGSLTSLHVGPFNVWRFAGCAELGRFSP